MFFWSVVNNSFETTSFPGSLFFVPLVGEEEGILSGHDGMRTVLDVAVFVSVWN